MMILHYIILHISRSRKCKLMYNEDRLMVVWYGEGTRDGRKGIQRDTKELRVVMDRKACP